MTQDTGIGADQKIERRKIGRTAIEVTPIGLGSWQFSQGQGFHGYVWSALSDKVTDEIVRTSLEGGISWIDTAEVYGKGRSERGVARALKAAGKHSGDVVIATKWFPMLRTAGSIRKTIGQRLLNLDGFSIDLYQIHQPWSLSTVEAEMEAMADLVEAGKIRAVGVSNFDADRMRRAHAALARRGLPLASNQVKYNLLDRRIERNGVLAAARELGITIIAYSPLEMGLLTGKFHRDRGLLESRPFFRRTFLTKRIQRSVSLIAALDEIAALHGVKTGQVALNWLINVHGDAVVAIPGASKVEHALQNSGSMKFRLSGEEMQRLDDLSSRLTP